MNKLNEAFNSMRGQYYLIININLVSLFVKGFSLVQETFVQGLVPEYFDRYYEAAVGIYSSGAAFGILILPLVTQTFLDTYGWRGTLLLLSGLVLHSVPFGGLIWFNKIKTDETQKYQPLFDSIEGDCYDCSNKDANQHTSGKSINIFTIFGLFLMTKVQFVTRVFVPALILGYTLTGWIIYMVSFAVSNGASLREATIVVTNGGIGMLVARGLGTPILHRLMTNKQILYISSAGMTILIPLMTVFTSLTGMNVLSSMYGATIGIFGTEVYISAKVNSLESEHFHAIAWLNLAYGIASIFTGFITG